MDLSRVILKETTVEDILKLYVGASLAEQETTKQSLWKDFEDAGRSRRVIYGAYIGERIVGTIQLVFIMRFRALANGRNCAHIHHLQVAEEFRGNGLGAFLLGRVEQLAENAGFKFVTLLVEEGNAGARRLYDRLGYKGFAEYEAKDGTTLIAMKKRLAL